MFIPDPTLIVDNYQSTEERKNNDLTLITFLNFTRTMECTLFYSNFVLKLKDILPKIAIQILNIVLKFSRSVDKDRSLEIGSTKIDIG